MANMLTRTVFCLSLFGLTACAGLSVPAYSNLPRSSLDNPTEIIDESAILFRADIEGCAQVSMGLSPELELGKYGKIEPVNLAWTAFGIPNSRIFHANGEKLHRLELPPGTYVIAYLNCITDEAKYSTPKGVVTRYGELQVTAGKTTYIGDIKAGKTGRRRRTSLLFDVTDQSESAQLQFTEKYPEMADRFEASILSK